MANVSCENSSSLQPSSSQIVAIKACQEAANTTYCYPPNGTRICVPSSLTFFWSPQFYQPTSKIMIGFDLDSDFFVGGNNTGTDEQVFTSFLFTDKAQSISGKPNEKALPMYFFEQRVTIDAEQSNIATHIGPTVTLVNTIELSPASSRTMRPSSSSTSRSSSRYHDYSDKKRTLSSKAISGIILGVLFGIVGMWVLCCVVSRKKKANSRRGVAVSQSTRTTTSAEAQQDSRPITTRYQRDPDVESLPPYTQDYNPPKYTP